MATTAAVRFGLAQSLFMPPVSVRFEEAKKKWKKNEKTVAKSQVNFLSTQTQKAMKCSLL